MEPAAFLLELRRRLVVEQPAHPLAAALAFLDAHRDTAEAQGLRRVIVTIATGQGVLADSDLWLFSQVTTAIAAGLIEARLEGRYSEDEWQRACSL